MSLAKSISSNIRHWRQERQLTQSEFADAVNELFRFDPEWKQRTVSDIERSRRRVAVTELVAIAEVLDVPVVRLMSTGGEATLGGKTFENYEYRKRLLGEHGDVLYEALEIVSASYSRALATGVVERTFAEAAVLASLEPAERNRRRALIWNHVSDMYRR